MSEVTLDHSGRYEPRQKPIEYSEKRFDGTFVLPVSFIDALLSMRRTNAEPMAQRNPNDSHMAMPVQSPDIEQETDLRQVRERTEEQ